MVSLRLDQRRMLAIVLMESFMMNTKEVVQEAGLIVGFNEKIVRRHCNEFFKNKGYLPESQQGKHESHCIYTSTRKPESG